MPDFTENVSAATDGLPEGGLPEVERALVLSHALRLPAGRALVLHATDDCPYGNLHHLSAVHLYLHEVGFGGDLQCAPDALAFGKETFRLVVVQHCADALPCVDALIEEIDRILIPGAALLWFGANPWNARALPRRLGDAARNRSVGSPSAGHLRQLLSRRGFGAFDVSGLGGIWSPAGARSGPRWLDPLRGAYQLVARKQRVTPVRPNALRPVRHMPIPGQLVGSQSRRTCACARLDLE